MLRETATSLIELQDDSGFFHHILDTSTEERSPLETSGTCMFSYTFKRGVELGILDDRFEESARRGIDVCTGVVSDDGAVRRVADKPGGPGAPLSVTSFGQGWFLLAASEFV
jgi:unsaturated rhamnogalacturonyl hydrolase